MPTEKFDLFKTFYAITKSGNLDTSSYRPGSEILPLTWPQLSATPCGILPLDVHLLERSGLIMPS